MHVQNSVPKALPQAPPKEQKKKTGASAAPAKPVSARPLSTSYVQACIEQHNCMEGSCLLLGPPSPARLKVHRCNRAGAVLLRRADTIHGLYTVLCAPVCALHDSTTFGSLIRLQYVEELQEMSSDLTQAFTLAVSGFPT